MLDTSLALVSCIGGKGDVVVFVYLYTLMLSCAVKVISKPDPVIS